MSAIVSGVVFVLGVVLFACAPANAATEFCAATVSAFIPIHDLVASKTDMGTDTEFGFKLRAESARTVDATLSVYAGGELYQLTMHDVALTEHTESDKLYPSRSDAILVRTVFESKPLYLRFAAPTTVDAAWISEAAQQTSAKGCPTLPYAANANPLRATVTSDVTDTTVRAMADRAAPQIKHIAHIDPGSCTSKFIAAKAQTIMYPDYPASALASSLGPVIVVATIALDSSGKVLDAWIIGSSGNLQVDAATLRAARTSNFIPAQFLCVPVPGVYQFRADFDPAP